MKDCLSLVDSKKLPPTPPPKKKEKKLTKGSSQPAAWRSLHPRRHHLRGGGPPLRRVRRVRLRGAAVRRLGGEHAEGGGGVDGAEVQHQNHAWVTESSLSQLGGRLLFEARQPFWVALKGGEGEVKMAWFCLGGGRF